MRIEIGKQRMTDASQALRPDFQGGYRVAGQAEHLGAFFRILLQRTVEVRGLIASSTGKCEREGRNDHPFRIAKLAKRNFAAVMGLELELRGCFADFRHGLLLATRDERGSILNPRAGCTTRKTRPAKEYSSQADLLQQRLRFFQISRIEALGKPVVDGL